MQSILETWTLHQSLGYEALGVPINRRVVRPQVLTCMIRDLSPHRDTKSETANHVWYQRIICS